MSLLGSLQLRNHCNTVCFCVFVCAVRMRCQQLFQVCVVLIAFLVQLLASHLVTLITAPSTAACCTSRERVHMSWHRIVKVETSGERVTMVTHATAPWHQTCLVYCFLCCCFVSWKYWEITLNADAFMLSCLISQLYHVAAVFAVIFSQDGSNWKIVPMLKISSIFL